MQKFMEKWRRFLFESEAKARFLEKRKQRREFLNEISSNFASQFNDYVGKHIDNDTAFPFNDMFGGALRIAAPLHSEDAEYLIEVVSALKEDGWDQDFGVEKRKQKQQELGPNGREYEVEVEVGKLDVVKTTVRVIPKGPREGEEVKSQVKTTMGKAINKSSNISQEAKDWWARKQSFYTVEGNWHIPRALFYRDLSRYPGTDKTVILSRHPIDVVRMSDFTNIHSCHSQGGEYFYCAVADANSQGAIAYLVDKEELKSLLEGRGLNDISDADDQEIFADAERGQRGLRPVSRVRIRQFKDDTDDTEYAGVAKSTYGNHYPGFREAVVDLVFEKQKHMLMSEDGKPIIPDPNDLLSFGGSYRDGDPDADILYDVFEKIPGATGTEELEEYEGYGDFPYAGHEDTDDNAAGFIDVWEQEVDRLNNYVEANFEHVGSYAEIDMGDEMPYVIYSGSTIFEFPLPSEEEIEKMLDNDGEYHPIDGNEQYIQDNLTEVFDVTLNLYNISDIEISEYEGSMYIRIMLENDSYDLDPDGYDSFIDDVLKEWEESYEKAYNVIRRWMIREEFLPTSPAIPFVDDDLEKLNKKYEHVDIDYDEDEDQLEYELIAEKGNGKITIGKIPREQDTLSSQEKFREVMLAALRRVEEELDKQLEFPYGEEYKEKRLKDFEPHISVSEGLGRQHSYFAMNMRVIFTHKNLFELDQDAIDIIKKTMEYLESRYNVIVKTAIEVWDALTNKELADKRQKEAEIRSLLKQIFKKQVISGMMNEDDFGKMVGWLDRNVGAIDDHINDVLQRAASGHPMWIGHGGDPRLDFSQLKGKFGDSKPAFEG
jgi:hypothetical protein